MNLTLLSDRPRAPLVLRLLPAAAALALIAGTTWLAARQADLRLRAHLLQQARIVANSLDPEKLARLSGTAADLTAPEYQRLKQQLGDICSANAQLRFAYLLGRKADGPVFFYVDSERAESPDCSPPGQPYDEASALLRGLFTNGARAQVEGPEKDRWGTWVSAFVPTTTPAADGTPLVLGLDIDASTWNAEIARRAGLPSALALLAAMLGLLAAVYAQSRREIRKRNTELRESEQSYRAQFANNSSVMLLIDPVDGAILDANAAALDFYGFPRERMLGLRITDINTRPAAEVRQAMASVPQNQGRQFEFQHRRADGSVRAVEVSTSHIQFGKRSVLHSIIHDITERKQAEERVRALLAESNRARQALLGILEDQTRAEADLKRLATAIEQAEEAIMVTDAQAVIQYVNPAFEKVTGYSRAEARGQNPRILQSGRHEPAFYRALRDTLQAGRTWHGRFINRRKDGSLYTEEASISPVCDDTGRITNYVAVKRNITDELRLAEQLQQAQKLESVGRLAGGVAHDFNNILTVILGRAEIALDQLDPAQPIHADLEEIREAARRAANITRQLLAFARKQTIVPRVLDLNEILEGMLQMLRRLIGENITLTWRPKPSLWKVHADPSQIDQILVNLCVNARDAIRGIGKIAIESGNAAFDDDYCAAHEGFVPGEFVWVAVGDNGCGMDAETRAHVFEPFFTTKAVGAGTGLGLATVYGIVKQNNGLIHVYSEPGQGTVFKIYLPRHPGPAEDTGGPPPVAPATGHETILLVEDDPAIRGTVCEMLRQQGYTLLSAATPAAALQLAQLHAGQIRLLLTDIVMPEMDGQTLARKLIAAYPRLKVMFMSGYTADVITFTGVEDQGFHFIQKPFSRLDLTTMVREILDEPAP